MNRTIKKMFLALLPALCQPPPDVNQYFQMIYSILLAVFRLPPHSVLNVHARLFAREIGVYEGRDVFRMLSVNRSQFYNITGETPETFLQLVILLDISSYNNTFKHKLSVRNRVLLFLIWLRTYPSFNMLSSIFSISVSTIKYQIRWLYKPFQNKIIGFVQWPTIEEWRDYQGHWTKIPSAVGAIDGTSHKINTPSTEPQEQFYSGHCQYHAVHIQVVVDCNGFIVHIESVFFRSYE